MNQERLLKVILAPHMSEKAAIGAEKRRQYVFEVASDATKTQVQAVRIVNVKSKPKRFGQIQGRSKAWKKAYVTLQPGQEISFAGGQ
jgi:large subunit ribosomal protein L23